MTEELSIAVQKYSAIFDKRKKDFQRKDVTKNPRELVAEESAIENSKYQKKQNRLKKWLVHNFSVSPCAIFT